MAPASSFSPVSSPNVATAATAGGRGSMEPVGPPARAPFPLRRFELRCAEVHPFGCKEVLSATNPSGLVECVCAHGARVHGCTPVFYDRERLAAITTAVTAL